MQRTGEQQKMMSVRWTWVAGDCERRNMRGSKRRRRGNGRACHNCAGAV